jgi:hypothetical protein
MARTDTSGEAGTRRRLDLTLSCIGSSPRRRARPPAAPAAQPRRPETRMADGDRCPRCERGGGILVRLRELAYPLFREVHIAPRSPSDRYRHAEERAHWRMSGGEPGRVRVGSNVGQPGRSWVVDQHPKHTTTAGPVPDRALLVLRKPASDPSRFELVDRLVLLAASWRTGSRPVGRRVQSRRYCPSNPYRNRRSAHCC